MSTIPVVCQCGQTLNARSSLAGKRVKCPKCGEILTIVRPKLPTRPKPQQPAPVAGGLDDLFDDVGLHEKPIHSGPRCSECDSPIAEGVVFCVACGFNSETGKITNSQLNKRDVVDFDPSELSEAEMIMYYAERSIQEGPEEETSHDFGDGHKISSYLLTIFLPVLMVAVGASVTIWGGSLVTWIVHIFKALGDKDYSVAIARTLITAAVIVSMIGWFRVTLQALAFKVYHGILSLFLLYFYALVFSIIDWERSKAGAVLLIAGFWLFFLGIASYMMLELNDAGATFMMVTLMMVVGGGFATWLGWFRIAIDAHTKSTVQGLLSLFIPLYAIVIGTVNWEESKKNMIIFISGSAVLLLGLILFFVSMQTGGAPKKNDWLAVSEIFFSFTPEDGEQAPGVTIAPQ